MSASQGGYFNAQMLTNLGNLGVGMRLFTYAYGTTTWKGAWQDAAGTISQVYTAGPGPQPDDSWIAMDARGECPPLYLSPGSYSLALKDSLGATVWTRRVDPMAVTANVVYNNSSNVFTGNQSVAPVYMANASTVPINAALSNSFKAVPTGFSQSFTLQNPTNLTDGMQLFFRFRQDSAGGRILTLGSMYKLPSPPVLTTTPNGVDVMCCYYDSDSNTLDCVFNKTFV